MVQKRNPHGWASFQSSRLPFLLWRWDGLSLNCSSNCQKRNGTVRRKKAPARRSMAYQATKTLSSAKVPLQGWAAIEALADAGGLGRIRNHTRRRMFHRAPSTLLRRRLDLLDPHLSPISLAGASACTKILIPMKPIGSSIRFEHRFCPSGRDEVPCPCPMNCAM